MSTREAADLIRQRATAASVEANPEVTTREDRDRWVTALTTHWRAWDTATALAVADLLEVSRSPKADAAARAYLQASA